MMIKRILHISIAVLAFAMLLPSCAKESSSLERYNDVTNSDVNMIMEYLRHKGLDSGATIHPSGLVYKIIEKGNGTDYINIEQVPTVTYERKLLKEERVVESSFIPVKFDGRRLKDHILGWQIGLGLVSKGGRVILYTPSGLAFGSEGIQGIIPPNAILIDDVRLINIE